MALVLQELLQGKAYGACGPGRSEGLAAKGIIHGKALGRHSQMTKLSHRSGGIADPPGLKTRNAPCARHHRRHDTLVVHRQFCR